jgi:hypothetical protein
VPFSLSNLFVISSQFFVVEKGGLTSVGIGFGIELLYHSHVELSRSIK